MKQLSGAFLDSQSGQCHFPVSVCCVNIPQRMGLCSQTEHSPAPSPSHGWLEASVPLGTSVPVQHPRLPEELATSNTLWVLRSRSQIPSSHAHSLLQIRFSSFTVQILKTHSPVNICTVTQRSNIKLGTFTKLLRSQ